MPWNQKQNNGQRVEKGNYARIVFHSFDDYADFPEWHGLPSHYTATFKGKKLGVVRNALSFCFEEGRVSKEYVLQIVDFAIKKGILNKEDLKKYG